MMMNTNNRDRLDGLTDNRDWHEADHQRLGKFKQTSSSGTWANRPLTAVAVGQRYFVNDPADTQHNLQEYAWNGTRWAGTQMVTTYLVVPSTATTNLLTATTANVLFDINPTGVSDVLVEKLFTSFYVVAPNDGANYWQVSARFRNGASVTTLNPTGTTAAGAGNGVIVVTIAVNSVLTMANFNDVLVDFNKVGAPGNMYFNPVKMVYRLLG